jgi:hypothetical protein
MTQASLRAVTLKTVANYRHAAEHAVGAYRVGGHRLIAVAQKGVDKAATRGAQPYAPRLAAAIKRAGDSVGTLAVKGVDAVSGGTERVIEFSSSNVSSQVERMAEMAGGVDFAVVVSGLNAAARLTLPGAQIALALSERVAAGAIKLETAVAGPRSRRAKAAGRARRATPARSAARQVEDAVVKAEASTKAVARRASVKVSEAAKSVGKAADATAKALAPKAARKPAPKPAAKPARRVSKKVSPLLAAAQDAADAITA